MKTKNQIFAFRPVKSSGYPTIRTSMLLIAFAILINLNACKDDEASPKESQDCLVKTVKTDYDYYEYFYEKGVLTSIKEGETGDMNRSFTYKNGLLTQIIRGNSFFSDTTYLRYNSNNKLASRTKYYEGELDDSISFQWNPDGTLKSYYRHYVPFTPGYTFSSAVFLTYTNGNLSKLERYYDYDFDGNLDISQMNSVDEYERIDVVSNDIRNPFYGSWIFDDDFSDEPILFCRKSLVSEVYTGNNSDMDTYAYTYEVNARNDPTRITMDYNNGEETGSFLVTYTCD